MWGLNAYLTSGAPQLLTVTVIQQSLSWPALSALRVQQEWCREPLGGLQALWMIWLTNGCFHPEKKSLHEKTSDPSVLPNLLRLLIERRSQKSRCNNKRLCVERGRHLKKTTKRHFWGGFGIMYKIKLHWKLCLPITQTCKTCFTMKVTF